MLQTIVWKSDVKDVNYNLYDSTIKFIMVYNKTQCSGIIPLRKSNAFYFVEGALLKNDTWFFNNRVVATAGQYQRLPGSTRRNFGRRQVSLNLRPTGAGFFGQTLYFLLTRAKIKTHNYVMMAEAEQFKPEPSPPVLVISRDYWNTVEPYEIQPDGRRAQHAELPRHGTAAP